MGVADSKAVPPPAAPAPAAAPPMACPMNSANQKTPEITSKCPVNSDPNPHAAAKNYPALCPMYWIGGGKSDEQSSPAAVPKQPEAAVMEAPSCPMKAKNQAVYKNSTQYNVYSQKLDPVNQMPTTANQLPSPEQTKELSTERKVSSIKKGGADDDATWVYPSPQMFWNALARKDKLQGVLEEDMDHVIAIHNNMNETTWIQVSEEPNRNSFAYNVSLILSIHLLQVLEWEKLHEKNEPGKEPKLLRFLGRPDDLSPKARLKMLFGYPAPFDRHDWTVDRGGRIEHLCTV